MHRTKIKKRNKIISNLKMKKYVVSLSILSLLILFPLSASAQDYEHAEKPFSVEGRVSGAIDWKLSDHISLHGKEEIRFNDNFRSFSKSHTDAIISYKPFSFLKLEAGYIFIYIPDGSKNRFTASIDGIYPKGNIELKLTEKIQRTSELTEINPYEKARNLYQLKTQLRAKYKIPESSWAPHLSIEARHSLNAVNPESITLKEPAFIDRMRFKAGTEWTTNQSNIIDFFAFVDYKHSLAIDATPEGILQSAVWESQWIANIGLAYKFKLNQALW